ncbi:uncharacterized protein TRIADDRAFT_59077 [Trichoplax adhaerens]|uniref:Uncharacterized protein n=1 Tax=Trichoplax adhaerens TaxID=10228 RepID=B3S4G6_TRIAD|nr:hypothetical protein TRIADDRAFT_59077 [Trichoplax adhaerens]EDV22632.1 hypothetical protein TRIADDRAFT_59077 [Trichoplax adhaerens]|eukprot:XP_002115176.1 hypothetical protein TRIADDRAFT_59077 [Trichoplax adhaerens]
MAIMLRCYFSPVGRRCLTNFALTHCRQYSAMQIDRNVLSSGWIRRSKYLYSYYACNSFTLVTSMKDAIQIRCSNVQVLSRLYSDQQSSPDSKRKKFLSVEQVDIARLVKKNLRKKEKRDEELIKKQLSILEIAFSVADGEIGATYLDQDAIKVSPEELVELAILTYETETEELSISVGEESIKVAAQLLRSAAMRGNIQAKYSYAQLLRTGQGIAADLPEAAAMMTELSSKGHPYAQYALAGMYLKGNGVKQDYDIAHDLYNTSKMNGIAAAGTMLGHIYRQGLGVDQDLPKSISYYKEAAQRHDVDAHISLAYCYSHGLGVDQSHEHAFKHYEIAASQGNVMALYNVGTHYFSGNGVTADFKMAAEYFTAAAEQGFPYAQVNLANMYYNGIGVNKDIRKAKEWYGKAATRNDNARQLYEQVCNEIDNQDNQ